MADVNKTIAIHYEAETKKLDKALKAIPANTDKAFKKASGNIDRSMKQAERAADKAAKKSAASWKKFGKGVAGVGAAFAAVGAGAVALGQHFADLTNELTDAETTTGIASATLSGLRLAAEGSGKSFDALLPGLVKFQQKIQQAAQGSKKAAGAFDELRVQTEDSNGELRDSNSVFNDTIAALKKMEPGTKRNAILLDLFGQSGAALAQSGAIDSMEEFTRLATEFGVDAGPAAVQAAADFQRNMANLKSTGAGAFQDILNAMGGGGESGQGINMLLEGLTQAMVYFGSVSVDSLGPVAQGFENIFGMMEILTLQANGQTEAAIELERRLSDETGAAMDNFTNMFDRADAKLNTYKNTVAATTKTQKEAAEAAEEEAQAREKQADATKAAAAAAKELARIQAAQNKLQSIQSQANQQLLTEREQLIAAHEKTREEIYAVMHAGLNAMDVIETQVDFERAAKIELAELDQRNLETIRDMEQAAAEERATELQREKDLRQQVASSITGSAVTISNALTTIAQNQGEITAEQAMRLHRLNKTAAISDITINSAVAVTKALAQLGPIGGPIAAVAMSGAALAQIAAVASAPPPTFDMGGMIGNNDPVRPDERMVRALTGERIQSRAEVRAAAEPTVIVMSPFRHMDRYNKSAQRRNTSLRSRNTSRPRY